MARLSCILLGAASAGVADAFRSPAAPSPLLAAGDASPLLVHRLTSPPSTTTRYERGRADGRTALSLASSDGADLDLAEEIETLDTDLAREIEEALALAQDALSSEMTGEEPDEDDIDVIASMLLETPPAEPAPLPLPPREEPPASVISLGLEEEGEEEAGEQQRRQPLPPETPPSEAAVSFAETLQKKAAEELEKLRISIFGIEEEIVAVEAEIEKEEDAAAALKKEIEENIQEREAMVKRIEKEFA